MLQSLLSRFIHTRASSILSNQYIISEVFKNDVLIPIIISRKSYIQKIIFSSVKHRIRSISKFWTKLMCAARPIKLSKFLKIRDMLTVQEYKNWYLFDKVFLWSDQEYYQSFQNEFCLSRLYFYSQLYNLDVSEFELSNREHKDLGEIQIMQLF